MPSPHERKRDANQLFLESALKRAAMRRSAAKTREALKKGVDRSMASLGLVFVMFAVLLGMGHLRGRSAPVSIWTAVSGFIVSVIPGAVAFWLAWRRRPQLHCVAEQLDSTLANHNAVATALDLSRADDDSAFVQHAIAAGIQSVQKIDPAKPIPEIESAVPGRGWAMLLAGAAAIVAAWLLPMASSRLVARVDQARDTATRFSTPAMYDVNREPTTTHLDGLTSRDVSDEPKRSNAAAARVSSPIPIGHPNESSPSDPASISSEAKGALGHDPNLAKRDQHDAKTASEQLSPPAHDAPSGRTEAAGNTALRGTIGAGDAASSNSSSDRPAESSTSSKSSGNPPKNEQASKAGESDQKGEKSGKADDGSGDRDGKDQGPPKQAGADAGNSASLAADDAGNSRGGGINGFKKSRGIAPRLLGSPVPDLFLGTQLAGPEERTTSPTPPLSAPGSLAAAALPRPARNDEKEVSPYCVPDDSRRLLSDYFSQFHADAEEPARVQK